MDTRNKILSLADAMALHGPLTIVTGTFDLLRAEHSRELEAAKDRNRGGRLVVAVLPSPMAWLTARARAEMVAALRVVDYVVTADAHDLDALIRAHPNAGVARLETADARRARQLVEHVQRRQKS